VDLLEDLPEEFTFPEPYNGAKYQLAEATDFSDERRVPIEKTVKHIEKVYFPVSEHMYASQRVGDDAEDLDLMTLQDVLIIS
jgi:hypothetical protein